MPKITLTGKQKFRATPDHKGNVYFVTRRYRKHGKWEYVIVGKGIALAGKRGEE